MAFRTKNNRVTKSINRNDGYDNSLQNVSSSIIPQTLKSNHVYMKTYIQSDTGQVLSEDTNKESYKNVWKSVDDSQLKKLRNPTNCTYPGIKRQYFKAPRAIDKLKQKLLVVNMVGTLGHFVKVAQPGDKSTPKFAGLSSLLNTNNYSEDYDSDDEDYPSHPDSMNVFFQIWSVECLSILNMLYDHFNIALVANSSDPNIDFHKLLVDIGVQIGFDIWVDAIYTNSNERSVYT